MASLSNFRYGSVWIISFDPSVATEIRKTRPGVIVSGTPFNEKRSKVTVLPFTSSQPNDPRISPAVVSVSSTEVNGLWVDSLLVCIEPMTFDKRRLNKYLGQLESEYLQQMQAVVKRYLRL
ncbi:type II toxin-antitoxin system PemK/MazF family toxin [Synechococcales cyanobacterium C]|uniref:Type II toxin-antitoxin system PemK/MazF family toxin n=1 Tax=Petrachloros mirabilis ULC683 TaxID=2781853 RepID=A0A8K2AN89_9CYAN|nr:type II toxin-antitoxin system PemK/MazF family toxin [Petrachloros mirabilis]NCJ04986.1 type II toxin-antitoxin system PemK/MazF family toxin [Petrachloros mirabilis ULC683]